MSAESQLEVIRQSIAGILPLLEEFVQSHYTPVSGQAQKLKNKLQQLCEEISVYEHYITRKEISSSFDIHAAVSQKLNDPVPAEKIIKEPVTETAESFSSSSPGEDSPVSSTPSHSETSLDNLPLPRPIPLSINDRFLVLRHLFKNSKIEWESAWQQFSLCQTPEEILNYLKSLREFYRWDEKDEVYQLLEKACRKKFSG